MPMNLILDNNQVSELSKLASWEIRRKFDRIVLSAHSVAEILCHPHFKKMIKMLEPFRLRFGFEIPTIADYVTGLPLARVENFEPFYSQCSENHRQLANMLENPKRSDVKWARGLKVENLIFSRNMIEASSKFRTEAKRRGIPQKHKFRSLTQAMREMAVGSDSYLAELILVSLSNGGKREIHAGSNQPFVEAVMKNPYLGRFFGAMFCYSIGISNLWSVKGLPHLRVTVQKDRDDWTDLSMFGYAGDGDIVLTADKMIRAYMSLIEPEGCVRAMPVDDFLRVIGC
jgi:hypothetical protein